MIISGKVCWIWNSECQGLVYGNSWLKIHWKYNDIVKTRTELVHIVDGEYTIDLIDFLTEEEISNPEGLLYMFFFWNQGKDEDNDPDSLGLTHTGMIKTKPKEIINMTISEVEKPSVLFEFQKPNFTDKQHTVTCSERSYVSNLPKELPQCGIDFYQEVYFPYEIDRNSWTWRICTRLCWI